MFIKLLGYGDAETGSAWINTVNDIPTTHLNRLYYCLNDYAYYEIDGGTRCKFEKNHIYILPQNINIKFSRPDNSPPFRHIYFDFIINPQFAFTHAMKYDLEKYPVMKDCISFIKSYFAENDIDTCLKYKNKPIFRGHQELVSHFLNTLLLYIDKFTPLFVDTTSPIHNTILYIYSNYNTDITINDLCKIALCNKSTLVKSFKDVTGKTPYQYIKDYRLSLSRAMLQANMPIKDIAENVGFLSASALSNSFYKKYGIYPADYRKMFN